jgi:hypothetical protein
MPALPALMIERTDLALPPADVEAAARYARSEKAPSVLPAPVPFDIRGPFGKRMTRFG